MNHCLEIVCLTCWGCYCCCHITLFSWDIMDEQCNAGEHVKRCSDNVVYKCNDLYKKIRKKGGYERVELVIEEEEPEEFLPETGGDKVLYRTYKPMDTLYELSNND